MITRSPRPHGGARWFPLVMLAAGVGAVCAAGTPRPLRAQAAPALATTQATARRQGPVSANNVNWDCKGTQCTTAFMPPAIEVAMPACQALAREVGVFTSLTVANRAFTAGELAQCNGAGTAVASTNTPSPLSKAVAVASSAAPAPVKSTPRSYPVVVRTEGLTVVGTGKLRELPPFTPRRIRTEVLVVSGTGRLIARPPFMPRSIRTDVLTLTGTGVLR